MTFTLIEPQQLHAQLDSPQMLVVDCRFSLQDFSYGRRSYLDSHIPGAQFVDLQTDLSATENTHGGRHPLPSVLEWRKTVQQLGINLGTTHVVVYDDNGYAGASRFWWMLNAIGHHSVSFLNGGLRAWHAAKLPCETTTVSPQTAQQPQQTDINTWPHIVDRDWINQHTNISLIDSREAPRYAGQQEPIDPYAGHIPGASNQLWSECSDSEGRWREKSWHQRRWQDIQQPENTIIYCGSGVTACVNIASMIYAGRPMPKLYPGSWSDWCSYIAAEDAQTSPYIAKTQQ